MSNLSGLIEFSSCLLQDTPDYVAYVAKDSVNQRGTVCPEKLPSLFPYLTISIILHYVLNINITVYVYHLYF